MTAVFRLRHGLLGTIALLLALGLCIAGCSKDNGGFLEMPANTVDDPGDTGSEQFSETLVSEQAVNYAEQSVSMVEILPTYPDGFSAKNSKLGFTTLPAFADRFTGKDGELGFNWNEAGDYWEARLILSDDGLYLNLYASVQFQDNQGQPIRQSDGADRMIYSESATLGVDQTEGDEHTVINIQGSAELVLSGLQTTTWNLMGTCSQDIEYTYDSPERTESLDTTISWEILPDGLSLPIDGCPSGTIRYSLPPYRLDIVFDGTDTASYTLYDAQDNIIPEASGTESTYCGS